MDWHGLMFGGLYAVVAMLLWAGLIVNSRSGVYRGKYKVVITEKDNPTAFGIHVIIVALMAMMASLMALVQICEALKKYFGEQPS